MEWKSVNLSNSRVEGNIVQGNTAGNIEAIIKSGSENQSNSENINIDYGGSIIGNAPIKASDNVKMQSHQPIHIHISEQKQTLAESAKQIQELLKQLEITNPTATEAEQVAYVNDETTRSFQRRVVSALQAGGEAAIEEFLANGT